jgi:hypothetical protein
MPRRLLREVGLLLTLSTIQAWHLVKVNLLAFLRDRIRVAGGIARRSRYFRREFLGRILDAELQALSWGLHCGETSVFAEWSLVREKLNLR